MRKLLIAFAAMALSFSAMSQSFIHGSVKKDPVNPNKILILFQPNYTSIAGEYVNYFQFTVAIPAAGNSGVTAVATAVNAFQDMGTLLLDGPYPENSGTEIVYNFGFLNPSPPSPVNHYGWTNGVDFVGVEIVFSTANAAQVGKMVDFTNNEGGFGGVNGNSLFGVVTNTGDKTDFNTLFYAIPGESQLGNYPSNGDQYVITTNGATCNAGTVTGNSPLCVGATATYTSNGDGGGTWSSSNTSVATVNASTGLVTAVGAGTSVITYTVSTCTASKTLTVNPIASAGTVSGSSPLCIGATAAYTSSGDPGGTWSSSNSAVASVDATGLVTALSAGTTNITYTVSSGCGAPVSASQALTVNASVSAGTVNGTSPLCIGSTANYTSTGTAGGSWSSSNTAVATVNTSTGLVTAVSSGTTNIIYSINSGCGNPVSSSKTLTVSPNANAGTVSGTSPLCITATATYASNGNPGGTWSSSNTAIATVNATSGLVTGVSVGTVNITYTVSTGCNSPVSASKVLTVSGNPTPGTVSGTTPLCIGQTATYTSDGTTGGTWSSSNTAVATVNTTSGLVTAVSAGTTNIVYTVLACNGSPLTSQKTLTVSPNVSAGTVSGTSPLCIGATATYTSNGAAGGSWSSSNTAVATVNATSGLVTAVTAGTTNITYTLNTGCGSPVSAVKNLTVSPNVSAGTISGTSPLCIGATATYTSNGAAGGTWSSSNATVATVNATSGLVTAVTAGTTNITYTVSSGCGSPVSSVKALTVSPNANAGTVSGTSPLCIGATATYTSNGDAGGSWSSSAIAIATVNAASGVVTAVSAGTVTITYTVSGCGGSASASKILTVSPNVSAGTVSGTSPLCIGGTAAYTSNGAAGGAWSSSNTAIATVNSTSGLVTAVSVGTANITYTVSTGCNNPVSASRVLTVSGNPTPGTVSGASPLCIGATTTYTSNGDAGGTWSSSNTAVATVNTTSGLVTAVSAGTTNIVYTVLACNGSPLTAQKTLTVSPNINAGTVSGSSPLCIGATATYSSNGDAGGTWSSSNIAVATVNAASGLVTAVGAGTTNITYTLSSGCGSPVSASKALTVSPNANAGTVSGASPLCIGGTATYTSNGDAGGTWSSSNTVVATVNATSGLVTAVTAGTTNITYTVNSGCGSPVSSVKALTVSPSVSAGTVSGTSPLCIGATATYTSNGDAGGSWSSSATAIATVNATSGVVTAVSAGTVTITYTVNGCGGTVSASKILTVSPNVSAGTVSGASPLCIGGTAAYTSSGTSGGTWSSSNTSVATVDAANGSVTALAAGTSNITYTVSNGCGSPVSAFKALTVSPNVNAGTVSGTSPLCIGASTTYTSNGDAGGTWSSSNTAVATVNATSGVVTSVGAGTTNVTYTIISGCGSPVSSTKTLAVSPNVNAGTVSGTSPLCIGATATYSSNGDAGGTWSSSNTAVATVNATTGVVTAVGAGTANITYTLSSGCGSPASSNKTVTVSPNTNAGIVSGTSPLCIGGTATYTSNGDAGGTWSSSNTAVATVDAASGLVTALSAGTVSITYTINSGCNAPVSSFKALTVSPNVSAGTVSGLTPLCSGATATYTSSGAAGGSWSSSNTAVATVNATSGLVTAVSAGTTNITYTVLSGCGSPVSSGKTLSVSPNVNPGTVSGTSPLCIGATATYSTSGDPGGSWSSSNTAVATVNGTSGLVTAVGAGSTNIIYTINACNGNPLTVFQTLTVNPNVSAGTVSGASPLCIGATATYSSNGNAGGAWSSSNTTVATVDATTGNVNALSAGSAIITYTVNTGCNSPVSSSKVLTVSPPVSAGTVTGTSPLCIGATATYTSNGNEGGTWSSSNTAVATVNATSGVVTAVSAGTTNIIYNISSGCGSPASAFKTLTVNPNANAGTVNGSSPLCIGATASYSSNGDAGGTWSSSNTAVATVNVATGVVTAVGAGTTNIAYTVNTGCNSPVSAFKTLTVSPDANAGAVNGISPLCIGATATYSSNGDAGGTWSSSNTAVATVNAASGLVTALSAGTTRVTYTVTSGCNSPVSASKILTVSPNAVAGTVSGTSPLCIGATASYSSDGNAGGTWSSSNTAVAAVSASSGLVTAVGAGSANIIYTVSSGCNAPVTAFKTITVDPNANAGTVNGTSPLCTGTTATYSSNGDAGGSWSSSNSSVATVDAATGIVTALNPGTTNITYTVSTGCNSPVSASMMLTVSPAVSAGTVSGTSPLCIGATASYSSDGTAGGTWSSTNTSVASVNATSGLVTALGSGTTKITYTANGCGGPFSSSQTLLVLINVFPGNVSGASPLCIGATATYTSNGVSGGTWSSSNTAVATVNATTGLVTTLTAGTTNITYTVTGCGGTNSSFSTLTVSPNLSAGTVSGNSPLCTGATAAYTSNGAAGGTWSSSNTAVASVNAATGLVTAVGAGTANIIYTLNSGCGSPVSSFKTLTVGLSVSAGTVNGTSPLCIGATATYASTGSAGGTWSSSNTAVATVNASTGLVTALSAGSTNIIYTVTGCGSTSSSSKNLTVSRNPTAGVVSGTSPLCIGATATYTSSGTAGGTWSSSNLAVATVNVSTGLVTAVSAGTANIIYTVNLCLGGTVSSFKTLTVGPNATAGTVNGTSPLCIGFATMYTSSGASATGTWSSSNTAVATVNATSGVVSALSAGTTNIIYTVNSGCNAPVSSFKTLTVRPNVTAGTVSGTSPLCIGATATYSSNGNPGGTWSSSNAAVASVNAATGVVTALSAGTVNITYTVSGCGGTSSASKTLAVNPNVTSGSVSGISPLCNGTTALYTSNGTPGGTWSSTNTAVATVNATSGVVTAVSSGTTNITYTVTGCGASAGAFRTLTVNGPYTIVSTAGANGTISPLGTTTVSCNGRQTYTIMPANCYKILDVLVDGVSNAGAILSGTYTFNNVSANHTIDVTFTPAGPFNIVFTATGSGTTNPLPGTATVACGSGNTYTFTANPGNHISTVLIDGVNNPAAVLSGTYTFTNVQANHTIAVTFVPDCVPGTVTISANSNPFCANLVLTANAIPSGPAYTYQWYRNGTAITGATLQTLTLTGNPATGSYTVKAINGACTSPASPAFVYNSQNVLQSYTILGTDNVDLGESNTVLHGSVGNTRNNGQVKMKKNAWVASTGAFVKAKNINIQSPSNVPVQILSPVVVTLPAMQYNTSNTNNLPNITISSNGTYNGNYKNVKVNAGVVATLTGSIFKNVTIEKGAQVTLQSAIVNLEQLDVKDGNSATSLTKVKFSNDCAIRASKNVSVGQYCQINPTSKFVVLYAEGNVQVDGKGTTVRSSIYAPGNNIQVNGDNNVMCFMTGRFIAKQVQSNSKNVTWDNFDCANPPAPLFVAEAENTFARGAVISNDDVAETPAARLEVKAYPNPSATRFNLKLKTALLNKPVEIRILDMTGKVMQVLKGNSDQVFQVGETLVQGLYIAELWQDNQKVSVKLVKQ